MLDQSTLKIFHAPSQDFEIFYKKFHIVPQNIFDTQIAARLCGFGQAISYAHLCESICGISLDKSQQVSNWLARPLPRALLNYAALDVEHLHQIHSVLCGKIKNLEEYYHILNNELLNPKLYMINLTRAWKKVKCNDRDKHFLGKLQMLAAFREEYAALSDVPRARFISDEDLIKLCRVLPTNKKELERFKRTMMTESHKATLLDLCAGMRAIEKSH